MNQMQSEIAAKPKIAVVVLNWNGGDETLACLDSMTRFSTSPCEIVVVDNGSTDHSLEALRSRSSEITLIENGDNLGFAEGNNVGITHALNRGAEWVLLVNNDTIVAPDLIERFADGALAHPLAGILGGTVLLHDRPNVIWFAG